MTDLYHTVVADVNVATVDYSDGTWIEIAIDDNALLLTVDQAKELRLAIATAIDWAIEE